MAHRPVYFNNGERDDRDNATRPYVFMAEDDDAAREVLNTFEGDGPVKRARITNTLIAEGRIEPWEKVIPRALFRMRGTKVEEVIPMEVEGD